VSGAALSDGIGQRLRDVLLTDYITEALWPIFPRNDLIRHDAGW